MKETWPLVRTSWRQFASACDKLAQVIMREYWGPLMLGVWVAALSVVSAVMWLALASHGTVPAMADKIDAIAAWTDRDGVPTLVVNGIRRRFVDCSGYNGSTAAQFRRTLVFVGRGDVPAPASRSSSGQLGYRPFVTSRAETPDIHNFSVEIPVPDPQGLTGIRWTLDAFAGSCEDGEERSMQPVGLTEVPPFPKYPTPTPAGPDHP